MMGPNVRRLRSDASNEPPLAIGVLREGGAIEKCAANDLRNGVARAGVVWGVPKLRLLPVGLIVLGMVTSGVALFAGPSGGDLAKQQPKYHITEIPPAPVRTPEEELKTFKLP